MSELQFLSSHDYLIFLVFYKILNSFPKSYFPILYSFFALRDLIYPESFSISRIMTLSPGISPVLPGAIKMIHSLALKYL